MVNGTSQINVNGTLLRGRGHFDHFECREHLQDENEHPLALVFNLVPQELFHLVDGIRVYTIIEMRKETLVPEALEYLLLLVLQRSRSRMLRPWSWWDGS